MRDRLDPPTRTGALAPAHGPRSRIRPDGGGRFVMSGAYPHLMDTGARHEPTHLWQAVLNHAGARPPDHHCDPPVPVTARIVWATDGEERIDTVAIGWSGRLVKVEMRDVRWHANAIWLHAEDVERR